MFGQSSLTMPAKLERRELVLLPLVDDALIELRREGHRLRIAGAALTRRADGLEVPRHRRLRRERRALVRALVLLIGGVRRELHALVDLQLLLDLFDDDVLVAGLHRHGRLGDVRLVNAHATRPCPSGSGLW